MQFQKISILPPQKGLEFPGGWGFCKAKKFKEMYKAYLEFAEGWGGPLEKIPSMGEVWMFSGITHSIKRCANPPLIIFRDLLSWVENFLQVKNSITG